MIFSENRYPSPIKSGTGFFGIMLSPTPGGGPETQCSFSNVGFRRLLCNSGPFRRQESRQEPFQGFIERTCQGPVWCLQASPCSQASDWPLT